MCLLVIDRNNFSLTALVMLIDTLGSIAGTCRDTCDWNIDLAKSMRSEKILKPVSMKSGAKDVS